MGVTQKIGQIIREQLTGSGVWRVNQRMRDGSKKLHWTKFKAHRETLNARQNY